VNEPRRRAGPEVTIRQDVIDSVPRPPHTTAPAMPCADCGFDTIAEYYIVHDHVWAAAGMADNGGFLCIGDLERRLGRPLSGGDFPPHIPINRPDVWWLRDSPRMRALKLAAAGRGYSQERLW
jgi:hypothetical protein